MFIKYIRCPKFKKKTKVSAESRPRYEILALFLRAELCSTAVRKPVGNVNPLSQKTMGGFVVSAHLENCSTLCMRSRVHTASGFREGYAYKHMYEYNSHLCKNSSFLYENVTEDLTTLWYNSNVLTKNPPSAMMEVLERRRYMWRPLLALLT